MVPTLKFVQYSSTDYTPLTSVAVFGNLFHISTNLLCKATIKGRNLKIEFFFWAIAACKCRKFVKILAPPIFQYREVTVLKTVVFG